MDAKNSLSERTDYSEKAFKRFRSDSIYYYNYWIYVYTGFWTYRSPTATWATKFYESCRRSLVIGYGFVIAFFIIDAIVVRHDLEKLSFNLSGGVLVFLTLMKVALLIPKIDIVEDMLDKMENNLYVETIENTDTILRISQYRAKIMYNISRFFYVLLIIAYPLRIIADTALDAKTYLIPVPFKEKFEDYFNYVYGVQAVISTHFMVTVIAHDMFVYGIIIRFVEHLDILEHNIFKVKNLYPRRNFEDFVPGYKESAQERSMIEDVLIRKHNKRKKRQYPTENNRGNSPNRISWIKNKALREERTFKLLTENINHHQKLLDEIRSFSEMYSLPLLVQTWGFVTLIGIAIIHVIILSKKITPLLVQQTLYVGTSMTNLLSLCTFGSQLSSKSWAAADALYDTPWYEMIERNRKIILYMIQKLVNAPKLKGGGIFNINRITFLKFMQTSYNFVAVIRNVY